MFEDFFCMYSPSDGIHKNNLIFDYNVNVSKSMLTYVVWFLKYDLDFTKTRNKSEHRTIGSENESTKALL